MSTELVEPMQIDRCQEKVNVDAPSSRNVVQPVMESATIDLDTYATNYKGMARLLRLTHLADHCPVLRIEALRMMLTYVQQTYDIKLYLQIYKKLQDAIKLQSSLPDAVAGVVHSMPALDTQWIESTNQKAAENFKRLNRDLDEPNIHLDVYIMRIVHSEFGDHYVELGELTDAFDSYWKAFCYCASPENSINMYRNLIKVSVYLRNWNRVESYVSKAESMLLTTIEPNRYKDFYYRTSTLLNVSAGLVDLVSSKYKSAAKLFLLANFDHMDFPELLSPNDVATYGMLCALATFDRQEFQSLVISNITFKHFIELEPELRDIVYQFYEFKYSSGLKLLEVIKDGLSLDMYLGTHVNSLYTLIRERAMCQYCIPYLSVDMNKMAAVFNTTVTELEEELMHLILDGNINARIDSHRKVLVAKDTDQRSLTFERSIQMGKEFQMRAKALILRAVMMRSQIEVNSVAIDGNTKPSKEKIVHVSPDVAEFIRNKRAEMKNVPKCK